MSQRTLQAYSGTEGADMHFDADGDNTAQAVKTSAGNVYGLIVQNPNTANAFIQLFDVAAGDVTVGTTTPSQSYFIGGTTAGDNNQIEIKFTVPVSFETAITYACTTTATGSTDPTTGLVVNILYK